MTPDQAYQAFREANPYPVRALVSSGDAENALARAKGQSVMRGGWGAAVDTRRGLFVAAAAFIVVVAVISVVALFARSPGGVIDDPLPPPGTTTTSTQSETTTTTLAPPGPGLQAEIERFIAAYNAGDFGSLGSLLEPGLRRQAQWDRDPIDSQTIERVREQYEIEAELNTVISLTECVQVGPQRATCTILRQDDLTRHLGLPAQDDGRMTLEFGGGLVVDWQEQKPFVTDYVESAVRPFQRWFIEAYPELPDPSPCNGCPTWQANIGFADVVADYVEEWAATLE